MKMLGIVLLVVGLLALAYGGFSYPREEQKAKLGPIEFSVKEKERVNIPMWAGIGAVVAGAALLVAGGKRG